MNQRDQSPEDEVCHLLRGERRFIDGRALSRLGVKLPFEPTTWMQLEQMLREHGWVGVGGKPILHRLAAPARDAETFRLGDDPDSIPAAGEDYAFARCFKPNISPIYLPGHCCTGKQVMPHVPEGPFLGPRMFGHMEVGSKLAAVRSSEAYPFPPIRCGIAPSSLSNYPNLDRLRQVGGPLELLHGLQKPAGKRHGLSVLL